MDIRACIPAHKSDDAAVEAAKAAGFPALNPVLPELLEWFQDISWPVAQDLVPVMAGAGPEIVPPIREVLDGNDGQWKNALVGWLIRELDPAVRALLMDHLIRLAEAPTYDDMLEDTDEFARHLLDELRRV